MNSAPAAASVAAPAPVRVGVVSYINTLPLIDGIANLRDVTLQPQVPAKLVDALVAGEVDLALCSAIDFQRSAVPLQIVSAGMLGCAGRTHTVRLYARVPLAHVRTIAGDTESHTSVALAQLLVRRAGAPSVRVLDYNRRTGARHPDADAMLLIGDKVVNDGPPSGEWPHETDLGAAWHEWTGLPFVFAVWMTRADLSDETRARVRTAARVLDHQRRHNLERVGNMVAREAARHGWPAPLAREYLTSMLRFEFDACARQGLERFFAECGNAGLVHSVRPLAFLSW